MRSPVRSARLLILLWGAPLLSSPALDAAPSYPWYAGLPSETIENQIHPPSGYDRERIQNPFGAWLRGLPLKQQGSPVLLYNGHLKGNQQAHFRVVDLDVGRQDLQQCADAILRLRMEYLFSRGRIGEIRFTSTSGESMPFSRWMRGERPTVRGSHILWRLSGSAGAGHAELMAYARSVFLYAGSSSLKRDTVLAPADSPIQAGDIFVQGGSPGHAVLVLDTLVYQGSDAGRRGRLFLLGQSYMPAQEFHVLKNPKDSSLSPWYRQNTDDVLETPEWVFRFADRRRFPES